MVRKEKISMKNLAYNLAYLGGLWYTLIGILYIDTLVH
jgi:hypothetical protein